MSAASKNRWNLLKFLGLTSFFTLIFLVALNSTERSKNEPTFFTQDLRQSADLNQELKNVYFSNEMPLNQNNAEVELTSDQRIWMKELEEKATEIFNQRDQLSIRTKTILGESTEGGGFVGYVDKGIVRMIEYTSFGEMGKQVDEFYFENQIPFYIVTTDYSYNRPIYLTDEDLEGLYDDGNTPESMKELEEEAIQENRYYFEDGSLAIWIQGQSTSTPDLENIKSIDPSSDAFEAKEKEIIETLKKIVNSPTY